VLLCLRPDGHMVLESSFGAHTTPCHHHHDEDQGHDRNEDSSPCQRNHLVKPILFARSNSGFTLPHFSASSLLALSILTQQEMSKAPNSPHNRSRTNDPGGGMNAQLRCTVLLI